MKSIKNFDCSTCGKNLGEKLSYFKKLSIDDFLIGTKRLISVYTIPRYHYLAWGQLMRTFFHLACCALLLLREAAVAPK